MNQHLYHYLLKYSRPPRSLSFEERLKRKKLIITQNQFSIPITCESHGQDSSPIKSPIPLSLSTQITASHITIRNYPPFFSLLQSSLVPSIFIHIHTHHHFPLSSPLQYSSKFLQTSVSFSLFLMYNNNNNNNCFNLSNMPQSFIINDEFLSNRCIWVNGPVIVGAGPSGLAVAAGLKNQGVPFVILERANCIASLWQNRTYDRLKLHLPKQFCQLPNFPFPEDFPEYPTKYQFINYLESYAKQFDIHPRFNETVQSAKYDETFGFWRIKTISSTSDSSFCEVEYICRWLVVATGENAEKIEPEFEGLQHFEGNVMHAGDYKSGASYRGKRVLVVGCGNSGMEVSLDLCNHNAKPSMVVRSWVSQNTHTPTHTHANTLLYTED